MFRLLAIIALLFLFAHSANASKNEVKIEEAFHSYRNNEEVKLENPNITIKKITERKELSEIEILFLLQKVKNNELTISKETLLNYRKIQEKKTFKEKYGRNHRFVKAKDYAKMICSEIDKVIKNIKIN